MKTLTNIFLTITLILFIIWYRLIRERIPVDLDMYVNHKDLLIIPLLLVLINLILLLVAIRQKLTINYIKIIIKLLNNKILQRILQMIIIFNAPNYI
jgi:hypothetical protein